MYSVKYLENFIVAVNCNLYIKVLVDGELFWKNEAPKDTWEPEWNDELDL